MRLETFSLSLVITASFLGSPWVVGCSQGSAGDGTGGGQGTVASGGQNATGGTGSAGKSGSAGTSAGSPATGGTGGAGGAGGSTGGTAGTVAVTTGGATGVGGSAGAAAGGTAGTTGQAGAAAGGSSGAPSAGAGGVAAGGSAGQSMGGAGSGGTAGVSGTAGAATGGGCTDPADFTGWATGKGPADIGPLAVKNFKSHTGDDYGGAGYALIFSWFGALVFSNNNADPTDNAALITGFEPYATGAKTVSNAANATVDDRAFGTLPLDIYMQNQDDRCKTLGLARADQQWASTTSDGITSDARYWSDDMFMITGLQIRAYRATKDVKYRDRAAKTMIAYLAALQQSDGLMWHTKQSKAYWGRANGWFASGMTEMLLDLPTGSDRDAIMAGYKKMMDGLLANQISGGADDGAWRQVIDLATSASLEESSCTAMFTFSLVTGVRNGWLTDPKYAAAAKKGWIALGNKTNASGQLDKVCPGTGQADAGTLAQQQAFYTSIALGSNDMHGQAPLMWAANALLRKDCPGVR